MKITLIISMVLAATVAAGPAAHACGVPDFGDVIADVASSLDGKTSHVAVPVVELGDWGIEGGTRSLGVGYSWGTREVGGVFSGSSLTRIMGNARFEPHQAALAVTYGWYETTLLSGGLDLGVEANVHGDTGVGPTARLTLGIHGFDVQLTGTARLGATDPLAGAALVVVEVPELVGAI
jgi:hypothetical protein